MDSISQAEAQEYIDTLRRELGGLTQEQREGLTQEQREELPLYILDMVHNLKQKRGAPTKT